MLQCEQTNFEAGGEGSWDCWKEKVGDGEDSRSLGRLIGLAHGDSGLGDLGAGLYRPKDFPRIGDEGEGRRKLRSSTCISSSPNAWRDKSCLIGKRLLSGDSLLVGVWAGDGEACDGEQLLLHSDISMLEQEGSDSS